MTTPKNGNIKDWLVYFERGKVKAFDITKHNNTAELKELCRDNGIPIIGWVAFEHEKNAREWGEVYR